MYTVIRNYTGVPELADELKKRSQEVENEISGTHGFIAYYLIKTADGIASITVCEGQKGCEESNQRAANWLRQNMPNLKAAPPQIILGEVTIKFASKTAKV